MEILRKIAEYAWRVGGALVSDTKSDGKVAISLGRVCFLVILGYMMHLWSGDQMESLPPGLMEVFYVLSGYVFGSKTIDMIRSKSESNMNMEE